MISPFIGKLKKCTRFGTGFVHHRVFGWTFLCISRKHAPEDCATPYAGEHTFKHARLILIEPVVRVTLQSIFDVSLNFDLPASERKRAFFCVRRAGESRDSNGHKQKNGVCRSLRSNVRNRTELAARAAHDQAMKTLFCMFVLFFAFSAPVAAQVHFDSGSARPNDPEEMRQIAYKKAKAKRLRVAVRCKDGTASYSRQNVCTGHGGARHR